MVQWLGVLAALLEKPSSVLISDSSQLPGTPSPEATTLPSGLCSHRDTGNTQLQLHKHRNYKNKNIGMVLLALVSALETQRQEEL